MSDMCRFCLCACQIIGLSARYCTTKYTRSLAASRIETPKEIKAAVTSRRWRRAEQDLGDHQHDDKWSGTFKMLLYSRSGKHSKHKMCTQNRTRDLISLQMQASLSIHFLSEVTQMRQIVARDVIGTHLWADRHTIQAVLANHCHHFCSFFFQCFTAFDTINVRFLVLGVTEILLNNSSDCYILHSEANLPTLSSWFLYQQLPFTRG